MALNEDSRVKIPAILHPTRLGYSYLSLKGAKWDESTNIFPDLFHTSIAAINPEASPDDIDRLLQQISRLLENEDLGKAFYEHIVQNNGLKLVDFENFDRNSFHVVTELTCKNGDDKSNLLNVALEGAISALITEQLKPQHQLPLTAEGCHFVKALIIKEYQDEFNGQQPA
jgi:type I restriction enzyme, R subunit